MGYVQVAGLGADFSPMLVRIRQAAELARKKKTATVKSVLPMIAKSLQAVKPAPKPVVKTVSQVKTVIDNRLRFFRPVAGAGQQTVKTKVVQVVPAKKTEAWGARSVWAKAREVTAVAQARPSIYPAQPGYMPPKPITVPLVSVEPVKKVVTPGGTEYKNTQVVVQGGIDPNRPESWVNPDSASGSALSIQESQPNERIIFGASPDEPTTAAEESALAVTQSAPVLQVGPASVSQAGFPPVLGIALGLLGLAMVFGKGKRR